MAEKDDSSIEVFQLSSIQREARRALIAAEALGVFPTPVDRILEVHQLSTQDSSIIDEGFLARFYRKASEVVKNVKKAIGKLVGFLDIRSRLVFIDSTVNEFKKKFAKLHEFGHFTLPWQRDTYAVLEDDETSLEEGVRDEFEREANNFAVEVMFQLSAFETDARDLALGLKAPISLAKRYGSSLYSAIRRYVTRNSRNCTVLVLNMPVVLENGVVSYSLRRIAASESFLRQFGTRNWAQEFTTRDAIGRAAASIRKSFGSGGTCRIVDRNGSAVDCRVEAFTNKYQIFLLIYPTDEVRGLGLSTRRLVSAPASRV